MHRKLVGLTAAAFAAAVAVSAAGPGVASAAKVERVSTLGKESFFAYVDKAAIARAKPDDKSKRVAKLTLKTPEKTDESIAFFRDRMTLLEVYHYGSQHFDFHRQHPVRPGHVKPPAPWLLFPPLPCCPYPAKC